MFAIRRLIPLLFLSVASFAQVASHEQIMQPPAELKPGLYPANANARADIKAAVAQAAKEHKRVILDFGADWCLDCHVLDNAFHNNPDVSPLLEKNYIVVHIDIGQQNPPKNNDVAIKYHVPLEKGVPALAVLDSNGKLLFHDRGGEFEGARRMKVQAVIDFLEKWKPKHSG
jgi:thiol:disulfide interchange protein